jgi:hypothetical protein
MKPGTIALVLVGVAAVGLGGYFLLQKNKAVAPLAMARVQQGASAVANMIPQQGATVAPSQTIGGAVKGMAASAGNKIFPGLGTVGVGIASKVSGPVGKALSSLKFW